MPHLPRLGFFYRHALCKLRHLTSISCFKHKFVQWCTMQSSFFLITFSLQFLSKLDAIQTDNHGSFRSQRRKQKQSKSKLFLLCYLSTVCAGQCGILCMFSKALSTSFPGSLILPPHRASEERPWHMLVTFHFDNWKHQGGVLCNQAIGRIGLRIPRVALCCDRNYPRWLQ